MPVDIKTSTFHLPERKENLMKVINIKDAPLGWEDDSNYVYIGRSGKGRSGYFGNPIKLKTGQPKGSTLQEYSDWLDVKVKDDPEFRERLLSLKGKTLVCFCKPGPCHGDVILQKINELDTRLMRITITGHRPNKLFKEDPYSKENFLLLERFFRELVWPKLEEIGKKPDSINSGMALGVDLAAAKSCEGTDIKVHSFIPFPNQSKVWKKDSFIIGVYEKVKSEAEEVILCSQYPPANKVAAAVLLQKRNEAMVGNCDAVLTLWDGKEQGGTFNCINYAREKQLPLIHCWDKWIEFRDSNS